MKILVDPRKTVYENIAAYYEEAKKWRRKAEGARKAMKEVERKEFAVKEKTKTPATKQKWFYEFHWAYTKNGFLVVAGKNAKQNDELVARHLKQNDLFFHAEIVGAPATVLKEGQRAKKEDLDQAAQFAACYSRAWKQGYVVVDVYAVRPEQVTKYSHGEFVGKGAFLISGERQWFKNTELKLYLQEKDGEVLVTPEVHTTKPEGSALISLGSTPKEQAVKVLAKRFRAREEALLSVLPGDVEVN